MQTTLQLAQSVVVDADDGTTYSHKDLVASRTLHYWVHAVNSAGLAPVASNPASASNEIDAQRWARRRGTSGASPSGVTFIDAEDAHTDGNVENASVNLYWNVPTGTEPDNNDDYTVQWSLDNRTWLPANALAVVPHGTAFGATPGMEQAMHLTVNDAVTTEKALYYRVKVREQPKSMPTATRVNSGGRVKRPAGLAGARSRCCWYCYYAEDYR